MRLRQTRRKGVIVKAKFFGYLGSGDSGTPVFDITLPDGFIKQKSVIYDSPYYLKKKDCELVGIYDKDSDDLRIKGARFEYGPTCVLSLFLILIILLVVRIVLK
jgi:hypothetical protein